MNQGQDIGKRLFTGTMNKNAADTNKDRSGVKDERCNSVNLNHEKATSLM